MSVYKIRLELERDETGAYTVTSPDVPELITAGYTMDEIIANVQDAIDCIIEGMPAFGKDIPPALRPENALQPERRAEILVAV